LLTCADCRGKERLVPLKRKTEPDFIVAARFFRLYISELLLLINSGKESKCEIKLPFFLKDNLILESNKLTFIGGNLHWFTRMEQKFHGGNLLLGKNIYNNILGRNAVKFVN
jgi:hypothetical protein